MWKFSGHKGSDVIPVLLSTKRVEKLLRRGRNRLILDGNVRSSFKQGIRIFSYFFTDIFRKKTLNQAAITKLEKTNKTKNSNCFWPRSRIDASSSLNEAISPKIWIESKQMKNKWKTMTFFYRFTSKAYSAAILSINFDLYQLKVPKQLTRKYPIWLKIELFESAVWAL